MAQRADDAVESRLAALEARVRLLEDQVAIYRLLACYGPSVDSRSEEATASLWTSDGRYDFGGAPLRGSDDVGGLVHREPHVSYVARGCAHVIGMPLVTIAGDRATATGYSRIYLRDGDGWKVERASANRWELVRTEEGWKVESRLNRLLDGSPEARAILARGVDEASGAVRNGAI